MGGTDAFECVYCALTGPLQYILVKIVVDMGNWHAFLAFLTLRVKKLVRCVSKNICMHYHATARREKLWHSKSMLVQQIEFRVMLAACRVKRLPDILTHGNMQAALIDELLEIMPKGLTRFAFQNSGSESVENAIKIARAHTKRKAIIAFEVHPPML